MRKRRGACRRLRTRSTTSFTRRFEANLDRSRWRRHCGRCRPRRCRRRAPPYYPLVRYHGVFAARSSWRAVVTPKPPPGAALVRHLDEVGYQAGREEHRVRCVDAAASPLDALLARRRAPPGGVPARGPVSGASGLREGRDLGPGALGFGRRASGDPPRPRGVRGDELRREDAAVLCGAAPIPIGGSRVRRQTDRASRRGPVGRRDGLVGSMQVQRLSRLRRPLRLRRGGDLL